MPPCSRIAHMLLADDIAIFDFYHCYSTHFPRSFLAVPRFAPADQYAAILFFSRSSLFTAYLWPVQAQHRYGAARLLFANHRLDFSLLCIAIAQRNYLGNALLVRFYAITYRFLSTPKQFQTYLFDSVPSLSFATLALANPHNALLVRFFASLRFTSCVACQRFAIASPIDAPRCFSTTFLCLSFSLQSQSLLCLRISTLFSWIAWLHYSFPMLMWAVHCHRIPMQHCSSAMPRFAVRRHRRASLYNSSATLVIAVHHSPMLRIAFSVFLSAGRIYSDAYISGPFLAAAALLLFRIDIVPDE